MAIAAPHRLIQAPRAHTYGRHYARARQTMCVYRDKILSEYQWERGMCIWRIPKQYTCVCVCVGVCESNCLKFSLNTTLRKCVSVCARIKVERVSYIWVQMYVWMCSLEHARENAEKISRIYVCCIWISFGYINEFTPIHIWSWRNSWHESSLIAVGWTEWKVVTSAVGC